MTIDPSRAADIQLGAAARAAEAAENQSTPVTPATPVRGDQVEISAEARAALDQGGAVDDTPVAQARVAEVQARLESGFYEQADTVRALADRLLESGDL